MKYLNEKRYHSILGKRGIVSISRQFERFDKSNRVILDVERCIAEKINRKNIAELINILSAFPDRYISIIIKPVQWKKEEINFIYQYANEFENLSRNIVNNTTTNTNNVGIDFINEDYQQLKRNTSKMIFQCCFLVSEPDGVVEYALSNYINLLFDKSQKIKKEVIEINGVNDLNTDIILKKIEMSFICDLKKISSYYNAGIHRIPMLFSIDEVVSFWKIPDYDRRINSIAPNYVKNKTAYINIPEQNKKNILLGQVTNVVDDVQLYIDANKLTLHGAIVGKPGSGKTTYAKGLLLQLNKLGIPFLAIEPTKREYRTLIKKIPELQIFTPANNVSPFFINPFIPPKGVTVEQYKFSLFKAFEISFSMLEPIDLIFKETIDEIYPYYGWENSSTIDTKGIEIFGLREFITLFDSIIQQKYRNVKELFERIRAAGSLRLWDLIRQNEKVFDCIHTIPVEDILTKPTVIELNAIENKEFKSLLMALILINANVYLKNKNVSGTELRNMIFIDEAHIFLDKNIQTIGNEQSYSNSDIVSEFIKNMCAEMRAVGTGIFIADQKPSIIGRNILSNMDMKVGFHLDDAFEINLMIQNSKIRMEDAEAFSFLEEGKAYISFDGINDALVIEDKLASDVKKLPFYISDQEIKISNIYWKNKEKFELLNPILECGKCIYKTGDNNCSTWDKAKMYAFKFYERNKKIEFQVHNEFVDELMLFHKFIAQNEGKNTKNIINCSLIQLLRVYQIHNVNILEKEIIGLKRKIRKNIF
ncbi:MAG: DUF87 domain-containing protein [Lachnospiraceae bacterium]|nr:DUF87 domain-containing protein [Lachnospiraceae bacterium]